MYGRIPYLNNSLSSWATYRSNLRRLLYYTAVWLGASPSVPLTVIQLNCNKKGYTIHALLNKHRHDTDILLLQEPRWGRIGTNIQGNDIKGPIGHSSWIPILPYTVFNPDDHQPRIMVYHRRCPGLEITLRSNIVRAPLCRARVLSRNNE